MAFGQKRNHLVVDRRGVELRLECGSAVNDCVVHCKRERFVAATEPGKLLADIERVGTHRG